MVFCKIQAHEYIHDDLGSALLNRKLIYLSGHKSSGKTTLLKKILDEKVITNEIISVYIDCYLQTSVLKLLDEIREKLLKIFSNNALIFDYGQISSKNIFFDFIKFLNLQRESSAEFGDHKIMIVLDHADFLEKCPLMDAIEILWNISQHVDPLKLLICTNDCYFLNYIKNFNVRADMKLCLSYIQVPPWAKDDLINVILQDMPKSHGDVYKKIVETTIQLFFVKNNPNTPRYITTLKPICQDNFINYIEKVENLKAFDYKKFVEVMDIGEFKEPNLERADEQISMIILLVAAYVAAYTKPSHDKLNFVLFKKRNPSKRVAKSSDQSKPFTRERLLHIHRSLNMMVTGCDGSLDQEYLQQLNVLPDLVLEYVSILEQIFVLIRIGSDANSLDSECKYRISARLNRSYIYKIAKRIDLELDQLCGLS